VEVALDDASRRLQEAGRLYRDEESSEAEIRAQIESVEEGLKGAARALEAAMQGGA